MSYSNQFDTEKGIYRLFRTTHGFATAEDIITPERLRTLDGIVLEITGDDTFHNPPDNVFNITTHEKVVKLAESLGKRSPAVYVVDVHMARTLTADLLLDFGAAMAGGGLVISGVYDLIAANRKMAGRRIFLKRSIIGLAKCSVAFPLGAFEKAAMISLGIVKGEIGNCHPLVWNYLDQFVPDIAVARDAVYARKLEEGVVPHLHRKKYGVDTSGFPSNSFPKIKIDIHCGAGHKRIPEFIQNKSLRDNILKKYAKEDYSVFDKRYLNVFFKFKYDPFNKKWIKTVHSIELFKDTSSRNI